MRTLANIILFNIGWFGCVLGGAHGLPWVGPVIVVCVVGVHLVALGQSRSLVWMSLLSFPAGWLADSGVVATGSMAFPERAGAFAPFWMAAMWSNFATTLHLSLAWMQGRWVVAALFGVVGGPLAYVTGARLGALEIGEPFWRSIAIIGVEWGIAMPGLLLLAWRVFPPRGEVEG